MIKVGIIGGAGYTGGEMIRLLLSHPQVTIKFIHSNSHANQPISNIHDDLLGRTDFFFTNKISNDIDVLFLCLGHGKSLLFLKEHTADISPSTKIIDLSNDFRLNKNNTIEDRTFVYGLPELQKKKIENAQHIANPGCFATAIQLGLLPLAQQQLLTTVHTVGITGSTGAGQSLSDTSHFSWRANNIQPYKTLTHQHLDEIYQSIQILQPSFNSTLYFVPWRGDFTRGIFVSQTIPCSLSLSDIYQLFNAYYASHPFVKINSSMIHLKQVVNTNNCFIHIEQVDNQIVVHSVIDNLIKGACGQAIQNMNLLYNRPETEGLQSKAIAF